jgi:hypothetical protein
MKGFFLCNKMLRLPFGLYLQFNSRANNEKNVLFFADIFTQNSFAQENLSWQGYFHTQRSKICQHQHKFLQLLKMLYSPRITTNVVKTTNTIDGLSNDFCTILQRSKQ